MAKLFHAILNYKFYLPQEGVVSALCTINSQLCASQQIIERGVDSLCRRLGVNFMHHNKLVYVQWQCFSSSREKAILEPTLDTNQMCLVNWTLMCQLAWDLIKLLKPCTAHHVLVTTTTKSSSFPVGTPNTHLSRLSFQQYRLRLLKTC